MNVALPTNAHKLLIVICFVVLLREDAVIVNYENEGSKLAKSLLHQTVSKEKEQRS